MCSDLVHSSHDHFSQNARKKKRWRRKTKMKGEDEEEDPRGLVRPADRTQPPGGARCGYSSNSGGGSGGSPGIARLARACSPLWSRGAPVSLDSRTLQLRYRKKIALIHEFTIPALVKRRCANFKTGSSREPAASSRAPSYDTKICCFRWSSCESRVRYSSLLQREIPHPRFRSREMLPRVLLAPRAGVGRSHARAPSGV